LIRRRRPFTPEEAVGRPVTIIIPLDRLDEEPAILEKIHRGERIEHFETVRQRKDGSLVDISLTISPIRELTREDCRRV
jgi:PAS domain S-box-containing protein